MIYSSQATVRFGAGHQEPNDWCGVKHHGHQYEVTVVWDREGFPVTDLDQWAVNRAKILDLAFELRNRDLNDMLGAATPNVFGVASFFMERLAINVPVTRVEVREDSDPVAIIERSTDY